MSNPDETKPESAVFDFDAYPADSLFHERREGRERRNRQGEPLAPTSATPRAARPAATDLPERRAKKERRRRIDPTTFEKQYSDAEMEFMNAMQRFKIQSGKSFPSHGDVLRVAVALGYRRAVVDDSPVADASAINSTDATAEEPSGSVEIIEV